MTWVLHPGGEARYYLGLREMIQVYNINTAQLWELGSCRRLLESHAVHTPPCSHRSPWTSHMRRRYRSLSLIARSLWFTGDGTLNKAECPPSARKSEHCGPRLKCWAGYTTKIARGQTVLHLPPPLKVLQDWTGRKAPELSHTTVSEVSPPIAAGDQVPPYLGPLTMARNTAVNPSSPMQRRTPLTKMSTWRFVRMMLKS